MRAMTMFRRATWAVLLLVWAGCDRFFEASDSTIIDPEGITGKGYPAAILQVQGGWVRLIAILDDLSYECEVATENMDEFDASSSIGRTDMGEFLSVNTLLTSIYVGLHDARNQADLFLTKYLPQYDLTTGYPTAAGTPAVAVRKQTLTAYATLMRGWATLYLGHVYEQVNFNRGPRLDASDALVRAAADFEVIEAMYATGTPAPEASWTGINIRKAANTLRAKAYLQLGRYDDAITASAGGLLRTDAPTVRTIGGVGLYTEAPGGNALFSAGFASSVVPAKRMSMSRWFIDQDPFDSRINLDTTTAAGALNSRFTPNDRELYFGANLGYFRPRTIRKLYASTLATLSVRILSWQENSLITAEANLYKAAPDLAAGIAAINNVRSGVLDDAGAPIPLRTVSDLASARADLEHEIRVEMCVENGYYFGFLRRIDRPHYWNPNARYRYPIPSSE